MSLLRLAGAEIQVQTESTFEIGAPTLLFEGTHTYGRSPWAAKCDVSPDRERFLMIKEDLSTNHINVVLNWFEELKRLVPTDY